MWACHREVRVVSSVNVVHLLCRRCPPRCDKNASATACRAPARCAPAGCDCPASGLWGITWRTALTAPPGWYTPTREATAPPTGPTPDTWSRRTRPTNRPPPRTWCTLRSRQTSALTTARQERWGQQGGPATAPLSPWMAVSSCAVDGGSRPGRSWSLNAVTALSTGAVTSAVLTAPVHKLYMSVCDQSWELTDSHPFHSVPLNAPRVVQSRQDTSKQTRKLAATKMSLVYSS